MQKAVPVSEGGMIAVLGVDIQEVNKLINLSKKRGVCEVANDNAKGQVIVSGNKKKLNLLKVLLKEKNKIYVFKSKRTFSLLFNETSCRSNERKNRKNKF